MKRQLIFCILAYFRILAQIQLKKNSRATIIGITGSAGKTSTRNAIAAMLKATKKQIKVSYKANSETGIPLNILGLSPKNYTPLEWLTLIGRAPLQLVFNWEKFEYYIVEMGIDGPDQPKNMEYLLRILQPDIGILLNAAPMHSEPFDYLVNSADPTERAQQITQLIANEKGKIVTRLNSTKTAIINYDQTEFNAIAKKTQAKVLGFGSSPRSIIQIKNYDVSLWGTRFEFTHEQKQLVLNIKDQLLPEHFSHTFAATLCVAIAQNLPLKEAVEAIESNFKLPAGRSSLLKGVNDSYIIDSSYNASTKPTIDLLNMLNLVAQKKKYAILGDVRELGKVAQTEHEQIAQKAALVCDEVCLVGPQMKKFAIPVLKRKRLPYQWFETARSASEYLKNKLKKDDVVLIKGSQNTLLLEIATESLLKNTSDISKLPRRGDFWDKRRAQLV